ncbi:MAG: HNH endonuclease signature motif containing protein [Pseudomonadota bacterium]
MTGRSVAEWRGATPDAKVPDRVRLRVFERHGGRCHLSGRKIAGGDAWDLDHVTPLEDGGEHRESNLAPALRTEHRKKTAAENTLRARERRLRKKHIGIKPTPRSVIPGSKASRFKKKVSGEVVER